MIKNKIEIHKFEDNEYFVIDKIEMMDSYRLVDFHRHDFYEVLWFTEVQKNDYHWIDFEKFDILPNQIYILSPGQIHQMELGSKKGILMCFSSEFFQSIFSMAPTFFLKPYCFTDVIPKKYVDIISKIIELIELEYKSTSRKPLITSYCTAFFFHITSLLEQRKNIQSEQMLMILQLIENHFITERGVLFYAKKVSVSIRRINEISIQFTGFTVKQLITDRLITESKRMITSEKLPYKEIAFELGFNDVAYFSRFLKKQTGYTPDVFRNQKFIL